MKFETELPIMDATTKEDEFKQENLSRFYLCWQYMRGC